MAIPTRLNQLADFIHKARLAADKYTPGPGTALSLMGGPLGWMTLGGDTMPQARILNNHNVAAAANKPAVPAAPAAPPAPAAPQANPANWGIGPNFMSVAPGSSWVDSTKAPIMPSAPQAATPPQSASVPMPQARPAEAPQAPQPQPDTSFFMRNALMMKDPGTGDYIDPMGAQSVRGPDLINKMMAYLHNKDTG